MPSQVGMHGDLAASEVAILRKSIEDFDCQASAQTKQIIKFTKVLIWLTTIMTVLASVQ
jgi:hypothetical protein